MTDNRKCGDCTHFVCFNFCNALVEQVEATTTACGDFEASERALRGKRLTDNIVSNFKPATCGDCALFPRDSEDWWCDEMKDYVSEEDEFAQGCPFFKKHPESEAGGPT